MNVIVHDTESIIRKLGKKEIERGRGREGGGGGVRDRVCVGGGGERKRKIFGQSDGDRQGKT